MIEIDKESPGWRKIVPETGSPERILTGCSNFADGPVWDEADGALIFTEAWMNRSPGKIWKWRPNRGVEFVFGPCKGLGATLDLEGRLIVAGWSSRSIWRREHDGSTTVLASHYGPLRINSPNDVVVHSSGAIYWTDPATGLNGNGRGADCADDLQRYLPFESVFRVWPGSGQVEPVADDFALPNGITFSPDERLLYVNDTILQHIRAFDVLSDGSLANGRLFYEAEADFPGTFDGMKVDVEGNVYCTAAGGIHVINPEGKLLVRIRFPTPVGNIAWGGPDWRWMFCTLQESIYRIELKIPGVPVRRR